MRKQCTTGNGMCKRCKEMEEVCPCSTIIGNLTGEDGQVKEDEEDIQPS